MAAFTTIADGQDWQAASLVEELTLAYVERRMALGDITAWQSSHAYSVGDIVHESGKVYRANTSHTSGGTFAGDSAYWDEWHKLAGKDAQALYSSNTDWPAWRTMQDWIYANYNSFIDDDGGSYDPDGEDASAALDYYSSWADFCAVAGLDYTEGDGFRAASTWTPGNPADWETDVSFSIARAEAGDIIGPWTLIDLQKAFSAMKWTAQTLGASSSNIDSWAKIELQRAETGNPFPTPPCERARNYVIDNWPTEWSSISSGSYYYEVLRNLWSIGVWWYALGRRIKGSPKLTHNPADGVTYDWAVYAHVGLSSWGGDPHSDGNLDTMQDDNGNPWVDAKKEIWDSDSGASGSTVIAAAFNPSASELFEISPELTCDDLDYTENGGASTTVSTVTWLLKWIFTNS